MALNAGRGERAKSPGCKSSTQRTSGESCESFGLKPSLVNGYLPAAIKTAWRPSSCEGNGDGLGTSWRESRTTSLAQPFTEHLKERRRGHATHLRYHPEAGPEQTHVAILHSRPPCHTEWWARVSECAIKILGHFFFIFIECIVIHGIWVSICRWNSSYHSSQDGDYVYTSPDDYSDSNDSY